MTGLLVWAGLIGLALATFCAVCSAGNLPVDDR